MTAEQPLSSQIDAQQQRVDALLKQKPSLPGENRAQETSVFIREVDQFQALVDTVDDPAAKDALSKGVLALLQAANPEKMADVSKRLHDALVTCDGSIFVLKPWIAVRSKVNPGDALSKRVLVALGLKKWSDDPRRADAALKLVQDRREKDGSIPVITATGTFSTQKIPPGDTNLRIGEYLDLRNLPGVSPAQPEQREGTHEVVLEFQPSPVPVGAPSKISGLRAAGKSVRAYYEHHDEPISINGEIVTPRIADNILFSFVGGERLIGVLRVVGAPALSGEATEFENHVHPKVPEDFGRITTEGSMSHAEGPHHKTKEGTHTTSEGAPHPVETLPKLQHISEADAAALQKIGVDGATLQHLDKMRLNPENIARFLEDAKAHPEVVHEIKEIMHEAKYATELKIVENFEKYGTLAFVVLAAYGFHGAENKTDFLIKTTVELGGFAGAIGAVRGTEMAVGNKIPNPLIRLAVDLTAATAGAMGGGKLYDAYIGSALDKYFPNRNTPGFWNNALTETSMAFLGAAFGSGSFLLDKMGIGDGVDAETDPLDYLYDTARMYKDGGGKREGDSWLTREYRMHTPEDLRVQAAEELADRKEFLGSLEIHLIVAEQIDHDAASAAELRGKIAGIKNKEIPKLESMIDGSWVKKEQGQLLKQRMLVEALKAGFGTIAHEKFRGKGAEFVIHVLERTARGEKTIVEPSEEPMWRAMIETSAEIGGGKEIEFREFVAFAHMVETRQKELNALPATAQPSTQPKLNT